MIAVWKAFLSLLSFKLIVDVVTSSNSPPDPKLIFTSYNSSSGLQSVHVWKMNSSNTSVWKMNSSNTTEVSISLQSYYVIPSSYFVSNLKALATDYKGNRIIAFDWLSDVIVVISLDANSENPISYFQLSSGIIRPMRESGGRPSTDLTKNLHNLPFTLDLAHDWLTGNFYSAKLNTIIAIDEKITYYVTIKADIPYRVTSLALHPLKRLLFYSTFGSISFSEYSFPDTSKLFVSDLSGSNETLILSYPDVKEIRSVTVNYINSKIYITDVSTTSSRVLSSNYDGTNLTVMMQLTNVTFQKLTTYQDHLYVIGGGRNDENEKRSYLWVISTRRSLSNHEKPTLISLGAETTTIGILVNHRSLYGNSTADGLGSCTYSPPCDQMCLPRSDTKRKCVCQKGDIINGTKCIPVTKSSEFSQQANSNEESPELILFVILLPTIAIAGVVIWYVVYWRKKQKGDAMSGSVENVVLEDDFICEDEQYPPKMIQELQYRDRYLRSPRRRHWSSGAEPHCSRDEPRSFERKYHSTIEPHMSEVDPSIIKSHPPIIEAQSFRVEPHSSEIKPNSTEIGSSGIDPQSAIASTSFISAEKKSPPDATKDKMSEEEIV